MTKFIIHCVKQARVSTLTTLSQLYAPSASLSSPGAARCATMFEISCVFEIVHLYTKISFKVHYMENVQVVQHVDICTSPVYKKQ